MFVLAADTPYVAYVFLGAVALVIGVLLLRVQRYYSRPRSALPSYPPEPKAARGHNLDAPSAMATWEVQMHDVARELSAQLDTKMGLLEHLIREADRAAARLEAAVAAAGAEDSPVATPSAPASPSPPGSKGSFSPDPPRISQAEGLKLSVLSDRASSSPSEGTALDRAGDLDPRPPMERRYEEIYTLADYGYDAAEIAQRIGMPVGEVQLILSLRGKR